VVGGLPEGVPAGAYAACAGALTSLTRAAHRELEPYGIRVHALTGKLNGYDRVTRPGASLVEAAVGLLSAEDGGGAGVIVEVT
jgi:NAD(P)-dependent dehydrogenase (short-subunit alcohol dehydrogenase family)